jgi:hypothetical protein
MRTILRTILIVAACLWAWGIAATVLVSMSQVARTEADHQYGAAPFEDRAQTERIDANIKRMALGLFVTAAFMAFGALAWWGTFGQRCAWSR